MKARKEVLGEMKILVYSHRSDETIYFEKFSQQYGVEVELHEESPSLYNAHWAEGYDCISIITTPISAELLERFYHYGVRFISTRTIGYDHIDVKKAKDLGVRFGNVTYSPHSVADYTIMLILMTIRKMRLIMGRDSVQDYSLAGVQGRELHNLTVGVIGTGKIGHTVAQYLSGFGCKVLAYDLYESKKTRPFAQYVPLEKLLEHSDLITLHAPATEDNYHMINQASIARMKQGTMLINTARGSLIDTEALIQALEEKKIGGAALDVIENESDIYYRDLKGEILTNRELAVLRSFPNVIMTPHTAFYTDQAVSDMVEHSLLSCMAFMEGKENPWEVRI